MTAEEFIIEYISKNCSGSLMVEFARYHVERALKAKIEAMREFYDEGEYSLDEINAFTKKSYPLENIK